jgi:hypothetical protein
MHQAFQVAPGPIYKVEKPVRNPLYLRWVKRFACAACGSTRLVDPAHTGPHGLSTKASDLGCIPLCRKCHDQFDADPKEFAFLHHLNISALIRKFNRLWKQKLKRTARQKKAPPISPTGTQTA